jgi:uncharacterized protein (TIGR03083 family)
VFDALYRDGRVRLSALARTLTDDQLATVTPGCPEWTVRDVLAHVSGGAVDVSAGRTEGAGSPEWTARQVAERRDVVLDTMLEDWAVASPTVEAGIVARQVSLRMVFDLLTHEADIHEALDLGRPDAAGWGPIAPVLATGQAKSFAGPGTFVLHVGGETYSGGDGDPVIELRADPYELFRGVISRRSRAQMLAWEWTGDAAAIVDLLPTFGPRDDDQPVPAAT